jgi:hypothetical protein
MPTYVISSYFWQFVDHWQTLITGIAALLAAPVTIVVLNCQIRQTRELANDQRQRQERAARAVLPLAVSELQQHARACIRGLYELRPYFQPSGSLDQEKVNKCLETWPSPPLPEDVLSVLKEWIQFSDNAPAEAASTLIHRLQVQKSRLAEYAARIRLNHSLPLGTIDLAIGNAAEVFARTGHLLTLSLGYPAHTFDVVRDNIYRALSDVGCFDFDSSHVIGELADKWERESQARAAWDKGMGG